MTAEEYFEENHVPKHSKLIDRHGLLYQESEIPKLMESYYQAKVKEDLADDLIHNLTKAGYSKDYINGVLNAKHILLDN